MKRMRIEIYVLCETTFSYGVLNAYMYIIASDKWTLC